MAGGLAPSNSVTNPNFNDLYKGTFGPQRQIWSDAERTSAENGCFSPQLLATRMTVRLNSVISFPSFHHTPVWPPIVRTMRDEQIFCPDNWTQTP